MTTEDAMTMLEARVADGESCPDMMLAIEPIVNALDDSVEAYKAYKTLESRCLDAAGVFAGEPINNSASATFFELAEQCQNIWTRRGQMSGRPGLFLWDQRRHEWRLAQDFKPYRASST